MSTDLQPARQVRYGSGSPPFPAHVSGERPRTAGSHASRRRRRLLADHPAWPIVALLVGYPLWWALGVADYMFLVLAIPMAIRLYKWHAQKTRQVRLPPGFSLWLLFLVCMLAGALTLSLTAPETAVSPVSDRVFSYIIRALSYLAVTVALLYVGNLTERELPRRRLAWLLGLLAIYVVAGGLGGTLRPNFQFTAPLALLVPHSVQDLMVNQGMLHPALAQVQSILGVPEGRPSAPFDYTNTWGNCLAILLPWLLVAWWIYGKRSQRWITGCVLVVAIIPIVYSLDRGLWLALVVAVCYLAVRLAARGRLGLLGMLGAGLALVAFLVVATPLSSLISQRANHTEDDAVRTSMSLIAIRDAAASPIIGFGDTRHEQGSVNSIAVGPTANCPKCGYGSVGGNGQFWLLLVTNGFVGTIFYLAFFAYGVWRYRRDLTPYGIAGVLVLLLGFVFMVAYDAVGEPLCFTMLAYALLWRNDVYRRAADDEPAELAAGATPAIAPRRTAPVPRVRA